MSCRVGARYGEQEFRVVDFGDREGPLEPFREGTREEEALFLARQWFPYWDSREKELSCLGDDASLTVLKSFTISRKWLSRVL